MMFHSVRANKTPHVSTDLEQTAITHLFPLLILMSTSKWPEILEAALRKLQNLSSWPCSDKGSPE